MPYFKPSDAPKGTISYGGDKVVYDGTKDMAPTRALVDLVAAGFWEQSDKPFKKTKLKPPKEADKKTPDGSPAMSLPKTVGAFAVDPEDHLKKELVAAANEVGVSDDGTKAEIAKRLSEHPDGAAVKSALTEPLA